MHIRMTASIEGIGGEGPAGSGDDRVFVMFHGYGNDEDEMVRIIEAVYRTDRDGAAHGGQAGPDRTALGPEPSYLSFRGTHARPYMGGNYWYPDGCSVGERRRACSEVGDAVDALLAGPAFAPRRKILVGFSQGGYLSYRMTLEHPGLFDAAVLLSPSFAGESGTVLGPDRTTAFFLAYGSEDRTIPADDQRTARRVLEQTGRLTHRVYPGMGHAISDQELAAIRAFLTR